MANRSKVFVSYSHKDEVWLERLRVHLAPLVRSGAVDLWDDSRIEKGDTWREEIRKALDQTRIAVLLISADFLASDFIANDELPPLLAAAETEGVRILPVILSPSLFDDTSQLARFQAVNRPSRPLIGMARVDQERLLETVARTVLEHVSPRTPDTPTETAIENTLTESARQAPTSAKLPRSVEGTLAGLAGGLAAGQVVAWWVLTVNFLENLVITVFGGVLGALVSLGCESAVSRFHRRAKERRLTILVSNEVTFGALAGVAVTLAVAVVGGVFFYIYDPSSTCPELARAPAAVLTGVVVYALVVRRPVGASLPRRRWRRGLFFVFTGGWAIILGMVGYSILESLELADDWCLDTPLEGVQTVALGYGFHGLLVGLNIGLATWTWRFFLDRRSDADSHA